ncbi:type II secretion system protein E [Caballeronia terrestris]|uniref:Type IV secretion system protein n=2 Tax=Caballeronia terrestris TaxID=1226301 RepID=A0A158KBN3_9BURK|nr:type II secretion system protein E [Caballeronia terrestris]
MPLHKVQSFIASDHAVNMTLAPLLRYLEDPDVFEVRVNKFGQVVTARTDGRERHDEPAITPAYVNNLTNTLLSYNGLGPSPIIDVKLPNGTRGVIVRPPAVLEGTVLICFRKHLQVSKGLEQLRDEGRFDNAKRRTIEDMLKLDPVEERLLGLLDRGDVVEFMREVVRSKKNICVSGKTGSGKSTLTRTLLAEVPPTERVLLLEDVHEVEADNQHEVGYMMYGKQEGRISAKECLTAAMRLSPDRIFLTELRDDAAWDYLTGANTGHPGGIFSTHADNAATTFARIATLVKASEVGRTVDYDVILKTVITTVDVVIYMAEREVKEIYYDPAYRRRQLMS